MNKLEETIGSLQELDAAKVPGYGASKIPNEIDEKITRTLKSYLELNEEEKKELKEKVRREHKFVFLAFAERMASLAIRAKSQEPLIVAMMAMFLQIGVGDVREDIVILILIYAAAHKLGLDPRSVFMEAARQFGLNDTSGLEAFLKRSNEDKSLDSMGYVEGSDEDGFRFVRTW